MRARLAIVLAVMSTMMVTVDQPAAHASGGAAGVVTAQVFISPGIVLARSDPIATTFTMLGTLAGSFMAHDSGGTAASAGLVLFIAVGASPEENALEASGTIEIISLLQDSGKGAGKVTKDPAKKSVGQWIRLGLLSLFSVFVAAVVGGPTGAAVAAAHAAVVIVSELFPESPPPPPQPLAILVGTFTGVGLSL